MKPGRTVGTAVLLIVGTLIGIACRAGTQPAVVAAGDPDRGAHLIDHYGCAHCHAIPGIQAGDGRAAPPLRGFANRAFIAGQVPNNEANLVQWLLDPNSLVPGTGMPDVGLSEAEARDVAAYLLSLR